MCEFLFRVFKCVVCLCCTRVQPGGKWGAHECQLYIVLVQLCVCVCLSWCVVVCVCVVPECSLVVSGVRTSVNFTMCLCNCVCVCVCLGVLLCVFVLYCG